MIVLEIGHTRTPEAEPAKEVRTLVNTALDRSGLSRAEVADELTKQVGERVTEAMLNDWSSQSKRRLRFPAAFIPALCQITGTDELARFLLIPRLRRLLSLGEAEVDKLLWERRKRKKRSACRK